MTTLTVTLIVLVWFGLPASLAIIAWVLVFGLYVFSLYTGG